MEFYRSHHLILGLNNRLFLSQSPSPARTMQRSNIVCLSALVPQYERLEPTPAQPS